VARSYCPRPQRKPLSKNRNSLLGLGGTFLLHAFAISPLIPGGIARKPDNVGISSQQDLAPPAEELLLLQITSDKKTDDLAPAMASLRSELSKLPLPPIKSEALPSFADLDIDAVGEATPTAPATAGDPALRALMFGRYTGQIRARIERAWMRPASPVVQPGAERTTGRADADGFRCAVQIRQDARGNVQEVLLLDCNGTEAWRHSLVVAINQSSPLPAPPIPTVYKRAITMTFEGQVDRDEALPAALEVDPRGETR